MMGSVNGWIAGTLGVFLSGLMGFLFARWLPETYYIGVAAVLFAAATVMGVANHRLARKIDRDLAEMRRIAQRWTER